MRVQKLIFYLKVIIITIVLLIALHNYQGSEKPQVK
jgi:hypothetical protein